MKSMTTRNASDGKLRVGSAPVWFVALFAALLLDAGAASDYVVSEPGTMTFPSPVSYGKLSVTTGTAGPVIFDQSSVLCDAAHANVFTAYDATSYSDVTFRGGWWDFSAPSGDTVNFYYVTGGDESTPKNRIVTFTDGAVVTNIGTSVLGGRRDGFYNLVNIQGGASVWMDRLALGQRQADQHNRCFVFGGGSLTLRQLDFTDSYRDNHALKISGNEVVVSNATSRLVVSETAYLSRPVAANSADGTIGGNTLTITDGAQASISNLMVNCAATHGVSNRVVVSKNAVLTTERCALGNSWSAGPNCGNLDRFEVLDGAAYTNRGSFIFGYNGNDTARSGARGETLIVSNATFVTKNFSRPKNNSGTEYWSPVFASDASTIILSGTDTVFKVTDNSSSYTDRPLFGRANSTLIIEDGMQFKYWNWGFANDRSANYNTVCVRSGAKLTSVPNAITTGSWTRNAPCRGNRLVVEDEGTVSVQYVWVSQRDSELFVSNATVNATAYRQDETNGTISVGGAWQNNINQFGVGTNCVLRVAGDHPKVSAANGSIIIVNHSRIAFDLPVAGYAENVIPVTTGDKFYIDSTSFIDVSNIRAVRKARFNRPGAPSNVRYTLVKAKKWNVADAIIAEANARLPKEAVISHLSEGGFHYLVCDIKPCGLVVTIL